MQRIEEFIKEKKYGKPQLKIKHSEHFRLIVECSGCKRSLFLNNLKEKKVGPSHIQLGFNFYLFNSEFKLNGRVKREIFDSSQTFEAYCANCFENQVYSHRFRSLYPISQKLQLMPMMNEMIVANN